MKTATVTLHSVSPMSQCRHHDAPKLEKESNDDYEKRTWREKLHYDDKERVFIPALALKVCLSEAAKFLSIQIPGKGKNTYTKHFDAGLLCMDNINLGIKKDSVPSTPIFVPCDGKRGGGKRVMKYFPTIHEWTGQATINILDETITESVLKKHIEEAGKFIGLGSLRVRNGGIWGRFELVKMSWK